jgi:lipoic acid synthetase
MDSVKRLPSWIKKEKISLRELHNMKKVLRNNNLHTVCESAMCPNRGECFKKGTATFLLLGNICTRNCKFCNVDNGKPKPLDMNEPLNIAKTVKEMNLKYVVLTMVNRDDLPDGGANHVKLTVEKIKKLNNVKVEILVGDFKGDIKALETVISCEPDIFNHNIEMVPSLFNTIRQGGDYNRSLNMLSYVANNTRIPVKSGFMVGLGESFEEVERLLVDLKESGVSIVTVGQYLRPTMKNVAVAKYYSPEEFDKIKKLGLNLGFRFIFAGPFVRSSYLAEEVFETCKR